MGDIKRASFQAEGDPYDPALIAETERILRNLPYLADAKVDTVWLKSGNVVINIITEDRYTLRTEVGFSSQGGN